MRARQLPAPTVVLLALSQITCGDGTGTGVHATARFLNGPTAAKAAAAPPIARSPALSNAGPVDGAWLLSPDKVTLTLTGVSLGSNNSFSSTAKVNCTATFDASKPTLAQLGDCPFDVTPGTFTEVQLTFNATFQVLVNDATNGFYSTASAMVTSAPSGGAVPLSVTVTTANGGASDGTFSITNPLPAPLAITDTSTLTTLSIVIQGLQFFPVAVSGGVPTVGNLPGGTPPPLRPDLIATVGTLGSVEFYSDGIGATTGSICGGGAIGGPCDAAKNGIGARLFMFYSTSTTPAAVLLPPINTSSCHGDRGGLFINNAKSYLGLDASGNLGWAENGDKTTNNNWSTYTDEWRLGRVTTLGGTSTLYCLDITADPAPSGGSFASGAPNIATAGNAVATMTLVAH